IYLPTYLPTYPHFISLQKRGELPWTSTKYDIICYNNTRHKPSIIKAIWGDPVRGRGSYKQDQGGRFEMKMKA
ncbi:hypothetical protein STEG23_012893, partial [Scotinomys teguina]